MKDDLSLLMNDIVDEVSWLDASGKKTKNGERPKVNFEGLNDKIESIIPILGAADDESISQTITLLLVIVHLYSSSISVPNKKHINKSLSLYHSVTYKLTKYLN